MAMNYVCVTFSKQMIGYSHQHCHVVFWFLLQWTDTFLARGSDHEDPGHPSDDDYDDHAGDLDLARLFVEQHYKETHYVKILPLPRFVCELLSGEKKQLGEVSQLDVM